MTKKKLIRFAVAISLVFAIFFGYYYYTRTSPVDIIPVGNVINAPEFQYFIFGAEDNPLALPLGVAVRNSEVFVSDSDRGQVQVYDKNGKFLRVFGDQGPGRLRHPYGIAFNGSEVYIADGGLGKIAIFDVDGTFKRYFEPKDGIFFSAPSQLVIRDGKLAFPDLALSKVFVFDLEGNLQMTFGNKGEGRAQMIKPHGLVVDDEGNYYVADTNNNRVIMFDQNGKYVKLLGQRGEEKPNEILTPRSLAIDRYGAIHVVSGLGASISVFNEDGNAIYTYGKISEEEGELALPNGIAIDNTGKIYITETTNNRLSVFK